MRCIKLKNSGFEIITFHAGFRIKSLYHHRRVILYRVLFVLVVAANAEEAGAHAVEQEIDRVRSVDRAAVP
jgi:hypothetical protein